MKYELPTRGLIRYASGFIEIIPKPNWVYKYVRVPVYYVACVGGYAGRVILANVMLIHLRREDFTSEYRRNHEI